jgi:hypothetical protein
MTHSTKAAISLFIVYLLLVCAEPAFAYIDPGTGSLLIQAVIAAIAAVAVSIGTVRRRIRSLIDRFLRDDKHKP